VLFLHFYKGKIQVAVFQTYINETLSLKS